MDLSRRDFFGVTAAAAVASLQGTVATADDPLGVRKDFPALRELTFLNTAYTGLIPQAVVDAAREWTDTRARRTYTVGEMLAKADEVRRLYAAMFGAGEDEIAFLSSTTEGENIVGTRSISRPVTTSCTTTSSIPARRPSTSGSQPRRASKSAS